MTTKWGALIFGMALVLVGYFGGVWLGRWFRISLVVLVVVVWGVALFMVHRQKAKVVRELTGANRETQDTVLAELDSNDRREILRRLGRDDA